MKLLVFALLLAALASAEGLYYTVESDNGLIIRARAWCDSSGCYALEKRMTINVSENPDCPQETCGCVNIETYEARIKNTHDSETLATINHEMLHLHIFETLSTTEHLRAFRDRENADRESMGLYPRWKEVVE